MTIYFRVEIRKRTEKDKCTRSSQGQKKKEKILPARRNRSLQEQECSLVKCSSFYHFLPFIVDPGGPTGSCVEELIAGVWCILVSEDWYQSRARLAPRSGPGTAVLHSWLISLFS